MARGVWAAKSLLINVTGSGLDMLVLMVSARLLGLPTPVAAFLGAGLGATFNFCLNRKVVFGDSALTLGNQALRYAAGTLALLALHATVVTLLADRVGFPLPLAKLTSDLGIMAGAQLILLRYFVFPKAVRTPAPAVVQAPAAPRPMRA